jgi:hypothetical protein
VGDFSGDDVKTDMKLEWDHLVRFLRMAVDDAKEIGCIFCIFVYGLKRKRTKNAEINKGEPFKQGGCQWKQYRFLFQEMWRY